MSGGSLNYFYSNLEEYEDVLGDRELNDLVKDLVKVFHDREWYDSGDISKGEYNETVKKFKEKWFTESGKDIRYRTYIDEAVEELRRDLNVDRHYCCECEHWTPKSDLYGKCEFKDSCLTHQYEDVCKRFALE